MYIIQCNTIWNIVILLELPVNKIFAYNRNQIRLIELKTFEKRTSKLTFLNKHFDILTTILLLKQNHKVKITRNGKKINNTLTTLETKMNSNYASLFFTFFNDLKKNYYIYI